MDIYTLHRTLDHQLATAIKDQYKEIWNKFPEVVEKFPILTQEEIKADLSQLLTSPAWADVQDVWFQRNATPEYWERLQAMTGKNLLPEQKRLAKVRKLCAEKVEEIIEKLITVSPTGFLDET